MRQLKRSVHTTGHRITDLATLLGRQVQEPGGNLSLFTGGGGGGATSASAEAVGPHHRPPDHRPCDPPGTPGAGTRREPEPVHRGWRRRSDECVS